MRAPSVLRLLSLFVLPTLLACGGAEPVPAEPASLSAALTSKVLYFGRMEVLAGQLKSADGTLPRRGELVSLNVFLPELGRFLCGEYCMALSPKLFIRFSGAEEFQEVAGIPQGAYVASGPVAAWPRDTAEVVLSVPSDADRIEAYMYWGRVSWNGATCRIAFDHMECPDSFAISGDYLSNYGNNFRINVQP